MPMYNLIEYSFNYKKTSGGNTVKICLPYIIMVLLLTLMELIALLHLLLKQN